MDTSINPSQNYRFVQSTGDLLVALERDGVLEEQDVLRLHIALSTTGETIGTLVKRLGLISDEELNAYLTKQFGTDILSSSDWEFDSQEEFGLARDYLKDISSYPLGCKGDVLFLAMIDPTDFLVIQAIGLKTGFQVCPVPISQEEFLEAFEQSQNTEDLESHSTSGLHELSQRDVNRLADLASDTPVVHLVETLFSKALQQQASDIHLTVTSRGLRVRNRIDGLLREQPYISNELKTGVISRLKILAGLDISEQRVPQDGRISTQVAGEKIDVRISTMPQVEGEGAVMRLLRRSKSILSLEDLGIPDHVLDNLKKTLQSPEGLFLVTGPTGSGKTTTLYAALAHISRPDLSISTIEDPVENHIDGIAQIQINPAVGLEFATALRSMLRQDPDIILVGEIRDEETASVANRAALTGHLVLSTLHTDSSVGAIPRLLDMGVEHYLLGSTLKAVMSQRLLPQLCERCKEEVALDETIISQFASFGVEVQPESVSGVVFAPTGCSNCNQTGYLGRVVVCELLSISPRLRQAIGQQLDTKSILNIVKKDGFRSMAEEACSLFLSGRVAIQDILRIIPPSNL